MSKRSHEESREERWLRKMKMYEEKISKKRRLDEQPHTNVTADADVQIEERLERNEDLSVNAVELPVSDSAAPIYAESGMPLNTEYDFGYDEVSVMTDTTACTNPNCDSCIETNEHISTDDFDPVLLRELGDVEVDPVEFGENLQSDLATKFQKILLEGLKKETKEELIKKYPFPKNVSLAKGPTLNPEIGAVLVDTCKQRDKRLLTKQDQLGKALSALGKALTTLLKKTPDIPEVIRTLNDAGMLLADSHYAETDTRRSIIMPLIDKSLSDPFKDRKRDSFLFGEKLGDLVKDSQGIKKTGQLIQPSTSTTSNLNGKGPSSRGARQQRAGLTYYHRAGGPRAAMPAPAPAYHYYQYPNRRRAAPAPPPPPARRPLMPPPPPPRRSAHPPAPAQHRSSSSRRT